jgi:hypothetical protein
MKNTQNDKILEFLKSGEPIDPLTALKEFGVMRLASRVFDLRTQGHNIISEKKTVINRHGEECHVAYYRLIGE